MGKTKNAIKKRVDLKFKRKLVNMNNLLNGLEILYELCSKTSDNEWSKTDVIMMAVHMSLINSGYKCLCLGENIPSDEEIGKHQLSELLPNGWNNCQQCYSLIYKYNKLKTLTLEVCDFVHDKYSSFNEVFKDKKQLENQLNVEICSKILKNNPNKSNDKKDIEEPRIPNRAEDLYAHDPLRVDNNRGNRWEPRGMIGGHRDLDPHGAPFAGFPGGARYDPIDPFDTPHGSRYDVNPDHFQPPRFRGGGGFLFD